MICPPTDPYWLDVIKTTALVWVAMAAVLGILWGLTGFHIPRNNSGD